MQTVTAPIIYIGLRHGMVLANQNQILGVFIMRGKGEIEAARNNDLPRFAGVDNHNFVVRAVMPGIELHSYSFARQQGNHAASKFQRLAFVGENQDLDAALLRRNERVGDTAMGEAECLHQHLLARVLDRPDNQLSGLIARGKGDLDCGGICLISQAERKLEGCRDTRGGE